MTVGTKTTDETASQARTRVKPAGPPIRITAATLDDPVANLASDGFGGIVGKRARMPRTRSAIAFLLLLMTLASTAVGIGIRDPCFNSAWEGGGNQQYTHMCYSDIPYLFQNHGFASRQTAYNSPVGYLEYQVVTGAAIQTAAVLAEHTGGGAKNQSRWFYVFTTWLLLVFAGIAVIALIGLAGPRPWDAAIFALAPGLMLSGTINWDLIAVGLALVGLFAWARRKPVLAGVFIGLASATKLYPALLLVALILVCWRAGKMQAWALTAGGAVAAWVAVNLPFMIWHYSSWEYFFTFNQNRSADWGSLWLLLQYSPMHLTFSASRLDVIFTVLLALSCVAVGLLTWLARYRPRIAQVAFLIAAAFILFNKVYSPQYVLWLIPLAALARPRWRDFLIWQACEVLYYGGIWLYLVTFNGSNRGLPQPGYEIAIMIHMAGTIFMVVQVIRDMLDPRRDPVRVSGYDDPAGGVLDGAEDAYGFSDLYLFQPPQGAEAAEAGKGAAAQKADGKAKGKAGIRGKGKGKADAKSEAEAQGEAESATSMSAEGGVGGDGDSSGESAAAEAAGSETAVLLVEEAAVPEPDADDEQTGRSSSADD
ncbi:MAG TPA: glycosyltransferase 87 family protein [Actinocrinis sp.]|nr:glycosyltransferase 87 family protein [Actinocrinis sp.]